MRYDATTCSQPGETSKNTCTSLDTTPLPIYPRYRLTWNDMTLPTSQDPLVLAAQTRRTGSLHLSHQSENKRRVCGVFSHAANVQHIGATVYQGTLRRYGVAGLD